MDREQKIWAGLTAHYTEALEHFPREQIVTLCLQGSQNYKLDTPDSDIDTKLIITPTFKDICLNRKPVSTTHIRANDEHIDFKDIRLYIETFRKQNLNFLEILFTPYSMVNNMYADEWVKLVLNREDIAHMNPYRAVKSMKGIAMEKYHAMEHKYPSKIELIEQYGYDPKQTSHLVRVRDYLDRYIAGLPYEECLTPSEEYITLIKDLKMKKYSLEEARAIADENIAYVSIIADAFCDKHKDEENPKMRELLEDVSYNIMKISTVTEILG